MDGIDNKSELVQVMAWCWMDNEPSSKAVFMRISDDLWHHQAWQATISLLYVGKLKWVVASII